MPSKFSVHQLMRWPAAVSADVLGLSVRDVIVAVGMIDSEDTGADATTGICTSTGNITNILYRLYNHPCIDSTTVLPNINIRTVHSCVLYQFG